jgi:anti-sigma factor RsiW
VSERLTSRLRDEIDALCAELERTRVALHVEAAAADAEATFANELNADVAALRARVAELEGALRPFASVGVPPNWPGECVLTWEAWPDSRPGHVGTYYAAGSYLVASAQGGPTIADFRRAAALLQEPPK